MKNKGVYKIIVNNELYIGSTTISFIQRERTHLRELKNNKHPNYKLQTLYNLGHTFVFEILEDTDVNIKQREQYYIDTLNPTLNIAKTTTCPMDGRKHSKQTLEKMKGKTPWNKGIPRTEEEKQKMSLVKRQRMQERPKEYFIALSNRCKQNPSKPFLGKHHDEKSKKLLREAHIKNRPKILCNETKEIFECQLDAAKKLKVKQGHISENLNNKRKTVRGYTFKYVK